MRACAIRDRYDLTTAEDRPSSIDRKDAEPHCAWDRGAFVYLQPVCFFHSYFNRLTLETFL
jgi:hypothetical protein